MTMAFISLIQHFSKIAKISKIFQRCLSLREIGLQYAYDQHIPEEIVEQGIHTLDHEQRVVYDDVINATQQNAGLGQCFFVHSAGGCGKTYLFNFIAAAIHAQGKIVLYVALSGIASLLLSGDHITHSHFKIPIPINEASICNIKKMINCMSY